MKDFDASDELYLVRDVDDAIVLIPSCISACMMSTRCHSRRWKLESRRS